MFQSFEAAEDKLGNNQTMFGQRKRCSGLHNSITQRVKK